MALTRDNVVQTFRATLSECQRAEFDACDAEMQLTIACEETGFDPDAPVVEYVRIPRAALEALRNDVEQFHTVRQMSAYATDENAMTKRIALARIDALLCLSVEREARCEESGQ